MDKTAVTKRIPWKFYFLEGLLACIWVIYLVDFYSFYKEAYFYIDKRLSMFLRLLSFLNENWQELFLYFVLSFLFMSLTLFFTYFIYLTQKKKQSNYQFFLFLNVGYCLALFINLCGIIFFILFILAASLVYIIFILANWGAYKNRLHDEEEELFEVKGPFDTEEEAQKESQLFKREWTEKEGVDLAEEIYLEADGKYYMDMYIEATDKTTR
ncbi:hypothetical protein [Enterococcus caccae]|uniref:Uncharacterized protein n=1 Tax=Enterococcus caccae ATCC BAA-1240 TaxID=1158612 RepID=R3X8Y8_9ENTE|nr:hypothetical protein [Enterococcus caccae]EOL50530.1 hypothetical protein UC7_00303 [Enterococcus caccae ATCC BAA-1240]EOT59254.1 hypothetical protein I580_02286 [Enterococcus caccae ATCC BAA-1240]OJG26693.1 hypothetical protein RU98_GL000483 [Enterococcus caccae]